MTNSSQFYATNGEEVAANINSVLFLLIHNYVSWESVLWAWLITQLITTQLIHKGLGGRR